MAENTRVCKICGKEYPYCTTLTNTVGNRWQDVACCVEHATDYFRQVAIARGEIVEETPKQEAPKKTTPKKVVVKIDEEKKEDNNEEDQLDTE